MMNMARHHAHHELALRFRANERFGFHHREPCVDLADLPGLHAGWTDLVVGRERSVHTAAAAIAQLATAGLFGTERRDAFVEKTRFDLQHWFDSGSNEMAYVVSRPVKRSVGRYSLANERLVERAFEPVWLDPCASWLPLPPGRHRAMLPNRSRGHKFQPLERDGRSRPSLCDSSREAFFTDGARERYAFSATTICMALLGRDEGSLRLGKPPALIPYRVTDPHESQNDQMLLLPTLRFGRIVGPASVDGNSIPLNACTVYERHLTLVPSGEWLLRDAIGETSLDVHLNLNPEDLDLFLRTGIVRPSEEPERG